MHRSNALPHTTAQLLDQAAGSLLVGCLTWAAYHHSSTAAGQHRGWGGWLDGWLRWLRLWPREAGAAAEAGWRQTMQLLAIGLAARLLAIQAPESQALLWHLAVLSWLGCCLRLMLHQLSATHSDPGRSLLLALMV